MGKSLFQAPTFQKPPQAQHRAARLRGLRGSVLHSSNMENVVNAEKSWCSDGAEPLSSEPCGVAQRRTVMEGVKRS